MRSAFLLLLLLSLGMGCRRPYNASYGGPGYAGVSATPQATRSGWWEVRPPNMGFACGMPAPTQIEGGVGVAEDGARYERALARVTVEYGTFTIVVNEWEGGFVGDPLAAARDLAGVVMDTPDLTGRRTQRLDIAGFYAREDVGRTQEGVFVALRQFVGRERLYVAVAAVVDDPHGLRAAENFMSSIELDQADALLPFGSSAALIPLYMPEEDFAVRMPPLTLRTTSQANVEGEAVDVHVFESMRPGVVYRVSVVDFRHEAPQDALAAVARQLSLGEVGAPIHASGFPGFIYGGATRGTTTRAFLTRRRVYALQVIASGGPPTEQASFIDSFRIL